MGSSPTGLCRSLLLIALSSTLLGFTLAYDYNSRPKPLSDGEGSARLRFRNRVEKSSQGSNTAVLPSAAAPNPWSLLWIPPAAVRTPFAADPAPSQSSTQEIYATVEKDFADDASLGEVISAAPEEPSPSQLGLGAQGSDRETETETDRETENTGTSADADNNGKVERVDGSEIENERAVEDAGFLPSSPGQEVSRLGAFYSPRPALSDPALYDRPACRNQDGLQGVCHMNPLSCKLRGGAFSQRCEGDNGVCCIFQHSCSAFTSERISYYRNPDFPFPSNGNLICNYKVLIQPKVCALRIDLLNYTTPITSMCSEVQLSFFVGNHTRTIPLCGVLTGTTVLLDKLNATTDKEVVISHVLGGKEPYRFELRVTQILCSAIKPFPVEGACGRRNIGMVRHKRSEEPLPDDKWYKSLDLELEEDLDSSDDIATRIVGGKLANVNEWPWQVALLKRIVTEKGPRGRFFCGGTLINREYVMTAAHCFSRIKEFNHTDVRKYYMAFIGEHDLRTRGEPQKLRRQLKRIIIHPLYDSSRNQYDIALLQLSKPVNYTGAIAPACLPSYSRNFTGKDIHITGWGVTSFNGSKPGSTSPILKTTVVKGVSHEECDAKWEKFDSKKTVFRDIPHVNEKQGCASNSPGTACFGDSGGPLMVEEENGRFTVIGIVSFGPPKCEVGGYFPTIYTRVSSFMDWIAAAMVDVF